MGGWVDTYPWDSDHADRAVSRLSTYLTTKPRLLSGLDWTVYLALQCICPCPCPPRFRDYACQARESEGYPV